MQGVGPAYSFAKTMATQTGRKIGLVVNARGGSSIQSNLPGLFFVAGEIAFWAPNGQASENIRAFNEMISHISDFIPNTACVSSEGLMPLIDYSDPHSVQTVRLFWESGMHKKSWKTQVGCVSCS